MRKENIVQQCQQRRIKKEEREWRRRKAKVRTSYSGTKNFIDTLFPFKMLLRKRLMGT